jgi:hypothetical protein
VNASWSEDGIGKHGIKCEAFGMVVIEFVDESSLFDYQAKLPKRPTHDGCDRVAGSFVKAAAMVEFDSRQDGGRDAFRTLRHCWTLQRSDEIHDFGSDFPRPLEARQMGGTGYRVEDTAGYGIRDVTTTLLNAGKVKFPAHHQCRD